MRCRALVQRGILLLGLFLAVLRFFNEGFRVKLLGEILDSRDDPRGGPIYGIADHRKAAIADGIYDAPSGKRGEHFDSGGSGFGMRSGENKEFRLQPGDFFKANLWPSLLGFHDGDGSRAAQCIRDKGVLANGYERLSPNNEQNSFRG